MSPSRRAPARPAPDDPVLHVADAVVHLDGRAVLHGVSLAVAAGEAVSLLGANGSGKSTLVRSAVGLVPLRAGSVQLFGTPLAGFRAWRRIGYVPQRVTAAAGVPATVGEVVSAGRLSHHRLGGWLTRADRTAVTEALEVVGLAGARRSAVGRLSGGQQQRVLIARALAGRPDLLILDEPMSGLDDATQRATAAALATLVAGGTGLLMVLHDLGHLEPMIDRCVVLRAGRAAAVIGPHQASADHPHEHAEPPHETAPPPSTATVHDPVFGLGSPAPVR